MAGRRVGDAERQREGALQIGRAVRRARRVLDALDETPPDQFDDFHYYSGFSSLDRALRDLLAACERVNWEHTAEVVGRGRSPRAAKNITPAGGSDPEPGPTALVRCAHGLPHTRDPHACDAEAHDGDCPWWWEEWAAAADERHLPPR